MRKLTPVLILIVALTTGAIVYSLREKGEPASGTAETPRTTQSGAQGPDSPEGVPTGTPLQTQQPGAAGTPQQQVSQMSDWDRKLEAVLSQNEKNPKQAVLLLLNMLPTLKEDEQPEAADHAANLLEDEDYASVMPQLVNPKLPEEVIDIFYTDLLNRPDEVKLPAMLEVAKRPDHPYHEEAKETLNLFLGEDYQENWPQWKTAIDKYLTNGE